MDYLETLGQRIQRYLRQDWDALIAVDGMEGSGKSVLAMQLGLCIDSTFDLDRVIYHYHQQHGIIKRTPRYGAVLDDEFGTDAFNREAMTRGNIHLVKNLMTCRRENKALIAAAPSFWVLDPYVRNHRCCIWIHVVHVVVKGNRIRGFAKIREPVPNEFGDSPFWKLTKLYRFKNLPKEVYDVYRQRKEEALTGQPEQAGLSDKVMMLARNIQIVEAHGRGQSFAKIGATFGISAQAAQQAYKRTSINDGEAPIYKKKISKRFVDSAAQAALEPEQEPALMFDE